MIRTERVQSPEILSIPGERARKLYIRLFYFSSGIGVDEYPKSLPVLSVEKGVRARFPVRWLIARPASVAH